MCLFPIDGDTVMAITVDTESVQPADKDGCASQLQCDDFLRAAATTIVASLESGEPLLEGAPISKLRNALLAESVDASDAAAARCARLREELTTALWQEIRARPQLTHLLDYGEGMVPQVRVEVRGTAGRLVSDEAFCVGSADECDVQAYGDPTVLPLQLLAIAVPGGVIVADFWSGGGTRMTWRNGGRAPASPLSAPAQRAAFVIPHCERVILRIGSRTTITLGPCAEEISKSKRKKRKSIRKDNSSVKQVEPRGRKAARCSGPAARAAASQSWRCVGKTGQASFAGAVASVANAGA